MQKLVLSITVVALLTLACAQSKPNMPSTYFVVMKDQDNSFVYMWIDNTNPSAPYARLQESDAYTTTFRSEIMRAKDYYHIKVNATGIQCSASQSLQFTPILISILNFVDSAMYIGIHSHNERPCDLWASKTTIDELPAWVSACFVRSLSNPAPVSLAINIEGLYNVGFDILKFDASANFPSNTFAVPQNCNTNGSD